MPSGFCCYSQSALLDCFVGFFHCETYFPFISEIFFLICSKLILHNNKSNYISSISFLYFTCAHRSNYLAPLVSFSLFPFTFWNRSFYWCPSITDSRRSCTYNIYLPWQWRPSLSSCHFFFRIPGFVCSPISMSACVWCILPARAQEWWWSGPQERRHLASDTSLEADGQWI